MKLANAITLVANRMTEHIMDHASVLGTDSLDATWYKKMIESISECEGFSFENHSAQFNFNTCVGKQISKEAYEIIFPPVYMDANGEYTTDSTKWV